MKPVLCVVVVLAAVVSLAVSADIKASPAVLDHTGSEVTVTWTDIPAPNASDVVSLYLIDPSTSVRRPTRIGWLPVTFSTEDGGEWDEEAGDFPSAGSVTLPLTNNLFNYQFAYERADDRTTALASSNLVSFFQGGKEPTGLHLATGRTPKIMTVSWTSTTATGEVQWGFDPNDLGNAVESYTQTYASSDLCGPPANTSEAFMNPGTLHYAEIEHNMETPTMVYYKVGEAGVYSTIRSFVTPDIHPSPETETTIFITGDIGVGLPYVTEQEQQNPAVKVLKNIADEVAELRATGKPSAMMDIGDISYARGYGYLWPEYMRLIDPAASAVPWFVSVGNHEFDYPRASEWDPSWAGYGTDSGGECGVPYERRFTMPPSANSNGSYYYTTTVGHVKMIIGSSETNFLVGSPQYNFIVSELQNVNRTETPFLLFMWHRPFVSSSSGHNIGIGKNLGGFDDHARGIYLPLFNKYKVNLVFQGHVHAWERSCGLVGPFQCGEKDEDGTVFITAGAGGNVYNPDYTWNMVMAPSLTSSGHHNQPAWSLFRTMNFGHAKLTANATHVTVDFIGFARGEVHDTVTLGART